MNRVQLAKEGSIVSRLAVELAGRGTGVFAYPYKNDSPHPYSAAAEYAEHNRDANDFVHDGMAMQRESIKDIPCAESVNTGAPGKGVRHG